MLCCRHHCLDNHPFKHSLGFPYIYTKGAQYPTRIIKTPTLQLSAVGLLTFSRWVQPEALPNATKPMLPKLIRTWVEPLRVPFRVPLRVPLRRGPVRVPLWAHFFSPLQQVCQLRTKPSPTSVAASRPCSLDFKPGCGDSGLWGVG